MIMEHSIKRILEKEFSANNIDMRVRVTVYAVIGNTISTYMADCFHGEGSKCLSIRMNAKRPFDPKVMPMTFMDPVKLASYCEIITEGINELERKGMDDFR